MFTNILIFLLVILSIFLAGKASQKEHHRGSAFLFLVGTLYMLFIRASVLFIPGFNDTEMVVGFWFIFCGALFILGLEE